MIAKRACIIFVSNQIDAIRHTVVYLSPCGQMIWFVIPVHLHTHWIALHFVEVGHPQGSGVEKLPPQQLPMQGDRRLGVFFL